MAIYVNGILAAGRGRQGAQGPPGPVGPPGPQGPQGEPGENGVTSFNDRTGAVTPQAGDYTAGMVGARPDTWTPTAADVGAVTGQGVQTIQAMTQEEYDALTEKSGTTMYIIKE